MKLLNLITLASYQIYLDIWIPQAIVAETKPTNISHAQKSSPHII